MIIFSDFDNTLFTPNDPAAFRRNLEAVQRFRRAGHQFCIATGRSLSSLELTFPEFTEYCDYLILDNGSICVTPKGKIIFETTVSSTDIEQLCSALQSKYPAEPMLFKYYYNLSDHESLNGHDVTKLRGLFVSKDIIDEFLDHADRIISLQLKAHPWYNPDGRFFEYNGSECQFFGVIDFFSAQAGKDQAIEKFCQKFGISHDMVITIGDDLNDIDMLCRFNGYAMSESQPKVLACVKPDHIITEVSVLIDQLLSQ